MILTCWSAKNINYFEIGYFLICPNAFRFQQFDDTRQSVFNSISAYFLV